MRAPILIGTAGWSIPRASAHRFAGAGTHLQKYAGVFRCAEINSSFHRSHSIATYEKWARSTPPAFRFAVKVPRIITHDRKLVGAREALERFLEESAGLREKRGPLLVQMPPSLAFEARVAGRFFARLRARHLGAVVCEPRHPTWLSAAADALLNEHQVARVAADPARAHGGNRPGGWPGLIYYRLHGAPRTYWSAYDAEFIGALAVTLRSLQSAGEVWCVFDNTASGAAAENVWQLTQRLVERHL